MKNSDVQNKEAQIKEVQQAMDDLIQTATSYNIDELDRLYHDNMTVTMINTNDELSTANKEDFKNIFRAKRDAGDPPMNTWAKYHNIEVKGDNAHVLLSRKNNLSGQDMILTLSIDFINEDDRWQVIREVIFLRPDDEK